MVRLAGLVSCLTVYLWMAVVPVCGKDPAGTGQEEKTESPYMKILGADPALDRLPLKSTRVEVEIAGVVAAVKIVQRYENDGGRPLEAVYVFPGSTRAAVCGMTMTVGGRVLEARIQEKGAARQEYVRAKEEGKSASLLEQERPNVFCMNVANIMPGDRIEVELRYTELLVPAEGIYEFVYPTVVMPRYEGPRGGLAERKSKLPPMIHPAAGDGPGMEFDLSLRLQAGMPVTEAASPSHQILIEQPADNRLQVRLDEAERRSANRDFVFRYALQGREIETGFLVYQGERENYFLLMLQPPRAVEAEDILPREYIFILDVSGSMSGFPLNTAKILIREMVGKLSPADRFNLILFAGGSLVLAEVPLAATPVNLDRALELVDHEKGGGGTELLPALKRALALPASSGYSRTMVLITDGGISAEREAFALVARNLGDANLFTFGVGSSVNRELIESLARAGQGDPFVVLDPGEAADQVRRFWDYVHAPVLTDIRLRFKDFQVYDLEPEILPDLRADSPLILTGKWKWGLHGYVQVDGLSAGGPFVQRFDLDRQAPEPGTEALRYLWARRRIASLADAGSLAGEGTVKEEITRLGLEYNLMTEYTSFIAVDSLVRNPGGETVPVVQPQPLPEGVGDTVTYSGDGVSCEVMVTGSAPLVDTTTCTVGQTITDSWRKQAVPLDRTATGLAGLTPGVSAGGSPPVRYQLDGADNYYPPAGWTAGGPGVDFDSISEIQVKQHSLKPEEGSAAGPLVSVITCSGTNQQHGGAAFYLQPAGWAAARRQPADEREGLTGRIFSGATGEIAATNGGYLQKDRWFYSVGLNLKREEWRLTAPAQGENPERSRGQRRERMDWSGKVIWSATSNLSLDWSFSGDSGRQSRGPDRDLANPDPAAWTRPAGGTVEGNMQLSAIFNPSSFLHIILARHHQWNSEGAAMPETAAVQDYEGYYRQHHLLLHPESPPGHYGYLPSGGAGFLEDSRQDWWQFRGRKQYEWSWMGPHSLSAGGSWQWGADWRRRGFTGPERPLPAWPGMPEGTVKGGLLVHGWLMEPGEDGSYSPRDLNGDGRVDGKDVRFILPAGLLSNPGISGTNQLGGFFVQDCWRITPGLSFEIGGRADFQRIGAGGGNLVSNWNLSPRLGFAWDPGQDGKSKFHGFWGRYQEPAGPADFSGVLAGERWIGGLVWDGIPEAGSFQPGTMPVRIFGGMPAAASVKAGLTSLEELVTGWDRLLNYNSCIGIRYIHRRLRRGLALLGGTPLDSGGTGGEVLEYRWLPGNPSEGLDLFDNSTGVPGGDGLPDGFTNPVRRYDALEVQFDRRWCGGFAFSGYYTLSRLHGNWEGVFSGDRPQFPYFNTFACFPDSSAWQQEFTPGPLPEDRRHRFKFHGAWIPYRGPVVGIRLDVASGTPLAAAGTHPVFLTDPGLLLEPRGSRDRTPWTAEVALHAGWTFELTGGMNLSLGADFFNILDRRSASRIDTRSRLLFGENPDFLKPVDCVSPFRARAFIRFEF